MIAPSCLGLAVATLAAQVPATAVLTLEEALTAARERSPDLAAARARVLGARELARKAWSAYLPTVTASGVYTFNSTEAKIQLPTGYYVRDMGVPVGPDYDPNAPLSPENPPGAATPYLLFPSGLAEAVIQRKHQLIGTVELSQAILAPALWPAIQSAYLAEEATTVGLEGTTQELLFATAQLYYGAVGLKEALAVQEQYVAVTTQHERDARTRFEAGAVAEVAYLRAQVERARAEQDLVRMRIAYAGALSALATVLDRPVEFDVVRPPPPRAAAAPERADPGRRPDVRAARLGAELAELGRQGVRARYLPNLGLFVRYQASNARGFTGEYDAWTAGLALSWVLWDGGLREAELREASAALVERQAVLRATEVRAEDDLRRALLDLESARANRVKAEEQLRAARETAKIVQKSYDLGAATYLELLDADAALRGAELTLINETLSADLAVLRVAKARGAFPP